jgi:hypothetical protein
MLSRRTVISPFRCLKSAKGRAFALAAARRSLAVLFLA